MKPRILLALNSKRDNYIEAVNRCGGMAVPQYCPEPSSEYDGLILCGGNDIDPKYYGEAVNGSVQIDAMRDSAEWALTKAFIAKRKPIMGICRGCQLLNVIFGGSLYQDIPNAREHSSFGDYDLVHNVSVCKESFLYDMYGAAFSVNSFHHQAIKDLGTGIDIMATTPDGQTIEGVCHRELPIFGLQWHPERMCFDNAREDTVDGAPVFDYFIRLCKEHMG